ncbi:hypothetical protein ACQ5SK_37450 [Bradyrhizobium japonicum]
MQLDAGRARDKRCVPAALDPQVPSSLAPGTILADTSAAGGTGIDPNAAVMPSPNSTACAEGVSMNLAAPATVLPANASGAAPTPGVSPILPPGC